MFLCVWILLPFFILAIVLSVLRSFCLSLFWPLYFLCFDPFAFLYFSHCIFCASILLPFFILAIVFSVPCYSLSKIPKEIIRSSKSKHRQYNGQNKERQKERSTDNTMAKIKKGKKIEAQTMQWPK
jgi:flagellar biosynthesis component FlhA